MEAPSPWMGGRTLWEEVGRVILVCWEKNMDFERRGTGTWAEKRHARRGRDREREGSLEDRRTRGRLGLS